MGVYTATTPVVKDADHTTTCLEKNNEPQADAILFIESSLGRQTKISEDDYIEGAPELIVEVAASSTPYDLHDKLKAYQRNGVKEYLVWRIYEQELILFPLS